MLEYADVEHAATVAWLQTCNSNTMIHGHTHKPAEHDLGNGFKRIVMTDWDLKAKPKRSEVLQLSKTGLQRIQLN